MNLQFQWLMIATVKDGMLSTSQRLYQEDMLRQEMTSMFEQEHGTGNWLITPTDDLPADFTPATYTIAGGELVKASAELLQTRSQAENVRKAETLRQQRNEILKATDDFTSIPDFPITEQQREQYKAYRIYLRDLPQCETFPDVPILTFEEFTNHQG